MSQVPRTLGKRKPLISQDILAELQKFAKRTKASPVIDLTLEEEEEEQPVERKRVIPSVESKDDTLGVLLDLEIKKEKEIGKGGYGVVYKAESEMGPFALKVFPVREGDSARALRELTFLSMLDEHPNVTHLLDFKMVPQQNGEDEIWIALPYYSQGDLAENLSKIPKLSAKQLVSLVGQILCGMMWLHSNSVVHFDVKPGNILVERWPTNEYDGMPHVRISDFGLSQWKYALWPIYDIGTQQFWPPESYCIEDSTYKDRKMIPSDKTDMFGVGIVILYILAAWGLGAIFDPPWYEKGRDSIENAAEHFRMFGSSSEREMWNRICEEKKFPQNITGHSSDWLRNASLYISSFPKPPSLKGWRKSIYTSLLKLAEKMIAFNPSERPSASEALEVLDGIAKSIHMDRSSYCEVTQPHGYLYNIFNQYENKMPVDQQDLLQKLIRLGNSLLGPIEKTIIIGRDPIPEAEKKKMIAHLAYAALSFGNETLLDEKETMAFMEDLVSFLTPFSDTELSQRMEKYNKSLPLDVFSEFRKIIKANNS